MRLGEQAQPEVLSDVGVLILVDQDSAKAPLVISKQFRLLREQIETMKKQIAEVAGIQRREPLLISGVELARATEGEVADLALRHGGRRQAAVLQAADDREQDPGRPAARVEIRGLDHLLQEPELIVGVEDREVGLEADQLGVTAEQPGAERMEGAEPEALDAVAEQAETRRIISRAALLVKVTAST